MIRTIYYLYSPKEKNLTLFYVKLDNLAYITDFFVEPLTKEINTNFFINEALTYFDNNEDVFNELFDESETLTFINIEDTIKHSNLDNWFDNLPLNVIQKIFDCVLDYDTIDSVITILKSFKSNWNKKSYAEKFSTYWIYKNQIIAKNLKISL